MKNTRNAHQCIDTHFHVGTLYEYASIQWTCLLRIIYCFYYLHFIFCYRLAFDVLSHLKSNKMHNAHIVHLPILIILVFLSLFIFVSKCTILYSTRKCKLTAKRLSSTQQLNLKNKILHCYS